MKMGFLNQVKSDNILAHQIAKDIFKTLIPELIANKDDESEMLSNEEEPKDLKRIKIGNT